MTWDRGIGALSGLLGVGFAALLAASCHDVRPASALAGPAFAQAQDETHNQAEIVVAYRRLSESQYRNTIADIFGPEIRINARFEPARREDGLEAIGSARLSITTSGMEQYIAVARSIADQVIDGPRHAEQVGCDESKTGQQGRACAERFLKWRGEQLFRRPLTSGELKDAFKIWDDAIASSASPEKALKLSLVSLLIAPEFLFRVEKAEPDPAHPGSYRLDADTIASRISFLAWDSAPDEELRAAARSGALEEPRELDRAVAKVTQSPRLASGVRALFTDMLQFDRYDTLTKDPGTYPLFSQAVADSSREETLRFLVDHLVERGLDYRDIFTSRDTFINRSLAAVYNVPFTSAEKWLRYTFPENSERSGILTQASFLSLFAHPASSSPTVRGVKLHEIFLCLPTPEPPPDVDFSKVQATQNGTVRSRLLDHMTNPGCSTCHAISDPAGLALEHFDGLGETRLLENGVPIDVSAVIDHKPLNGARGLGQYLHDSPLATACLVRNVFYSGVGRGLDYKDSDLLKANEKTFADSGFRIAALFRSVLSDPGFYKAPLPQKDAAKSDGQKQSASTAGAKP